MVFVRTISNGNINQNLIWFCRDWNKFIKKIPESASQLVQNHLFLTNQKN